jgi:hypothetical protein
MSAIIVLLVIGAAVAGVMAIQYYSGDETTKRKLRDAATWPIGSFPENTVGRVIGQSYALTPPMVAPLTGRPCVMYDVKIEEHVSNGKSSHWKQVIRERKSQPFVLVDDSGRAIVDPSHATALLVFDSKTSSGLFDPANVVEENFLHRHAQASKGWVFNRSLRYSEAIVGIGETIAVLGSGVREPDPEASPSAEYRGMQPTRVRLTSSARYPLTISDDGSTTQRPPA